MECRHRCRGFTLLELLIVVVVIGIVAAIAIPNLRNALDRSKQKRTMADMKSIGTAVEAYAVDHTIYPTAASMAVLETTLEPVFLRETPLTDGWGNLFVVSATTAGYTIGSGGKDGGVLNFVGGPTTNLTDAIIFIDGRFVQWPEGMQQ